MTIRTDAPPVPLVDLGWQHEQIREEITPQLLEAMAAGAFVGGPAVAAFEQEMAAFTATGHCVGVANGTDALELVLRAAGGVVGAPVILPANTFFATAEAVLRAGGRPVLVDCDPDGLIDVEQVADRLGRRTRAIIPVHLYGQLAPVEDVAELVHGTGAFVLEDGAQSQGATRHGRPMGWWGLAAATSFYPGKNLGAYGDAGAVLTSDADLADQVRLLASHGSRRKYEHLEVGCNSRLDGLQAIVLRAKLRRLADWNDARRVAAARYRELLEPLRADGLATLPRPAPGNEHVWHLYTVGVPWRDEVLAALQAAGIGAGIHYPIPLHLQPALRWLGYGAGTFPVAERMAASTLTLPLYPGITDGIQERVVEELGAALHRGRRSLVGPRS